MVKEKENVVKEETIKKEVKETKIEKEIVKPKKEGKVVSKEDEIDAFLDAKETKSLEKSGIGKLIFNIVFWVVLIGLAVIWGIEFLNVKNDKEPMFCLDKTIHEFSDGIVTECTGLGYKIYNYDRESINAVEFGPFFIGMKD